MFNELEFNCCFCNKSFKIENKTGHIKECTGLNYTCPMEGCNHNKDLTTDLDLAIHLKKQCKFIKEICENCELEIDKSESHDCVQALKLALAYSRSETEEIKWNKYPNKGLYGLITFEQADDAKKALDFYRRGGRLYVRECI